MRTTAKIRAACALLASLPFCAHAGPDAALGRFEASGARLGMPLDLALEAMAATKPAWAAAIAEQKGQALADCSSQGRAIVALASSSGRPTAIMDARCEPGEGGRPALSQLVVKSRLAASLTSQDVRSALASRYGQAGQVSEEAGGGFSMVWSAEPGAPEAPRSETLTAVLESRALDSRPEALTLRLSSLPGKPAAGARAKALDSLPF